MSCLNNQTFTDEYGLRFVRIPSGTFRMGCNDPEPDGLGPNGPSHDVTISRSFYMSTTPVTNSIFGRFLKESSYDGRPDGDEEYLKLLPREHRDPSKNDLPIVCVSWRNAVAFCEHLSQQTGRRYRLPTEAEWEYACRAGTDTRYFFGDDEKDACKYMWYYRNSKKKRHPAGIKQPNPWGLYDMLGNVYEWCSDWDGPYSPELQVDPQGVPREKTGKLYAKIIRGGCHGNRPIRGCAFRLQCVEKGCADWLGFRVVIDITD